MELEEALREIERLKAENESLRAELYAERAEKEKALLALLHEREKRKIAYARQFLPRTEKSSAVVINEAEEIIAEEAKKAPKGPRRRKFEGIDFERYVTETRVLRPDSLECPECGKALVKIGEKARYQIEADPINVRVIKLVKETYKCPDCNKRDGRVHYPVSSEAFPGTPLTPSLAAYLAYHKYELGVPFHHLERHFSLTLGIPISKQCMADWMAMTAERLGPVYERMKSDLLATPTKVIHADETTLTLSKRANPARKKSYVFVYASSFYDERQIHVYEFNETREIDPESSYLGDFEGWCCASHYFVGVPSHYFAETGRICEEKRGYGPVFPSGYMLPMASLTTSLVTCFRPAASASMHAFPSIWSATLGRPLAALATACSAPSPRKSGVDPAALAFAST